MNDQKDRPLLADIFRVGTPECAVFSGACAMVLGLLLLTVGFWNTVWIALLGAVGGFFGGVRDKKQILKNVLNRIIPDKKAMPYREQHPDIARAVRETSKAHSAETEENQSKQV
jgi:uncharacterized membrane protein